MGLIRQLDMELFGGCNYACQMCPQGFEDVNKSIEDRIVYIFFIVGRI